MSKDEPNFHQRFSCRVNDKIEGPFDLIELAGLFREGAVDGDTPVCREETEDWSPLRERLEYRSIQEIPVEIIARHLHEKERAGLLAQTSGKTWLNFAWIIFGCAMAFVGIMAIWSQPQPTAAPSTPPTPSPAVAVQADWPKTIGDHFVVKGPIQLQFARSTSPEFLSYRGFMEDTRFGVDIAFRPGHSDGEYQRIVDEIQTVFLERQLHATAQRTTTISGNGYQGQEISFNVAVGQNDESGKLRVVFGHGSIILLWVVAKPDKFSSQDIDRFLTSLEVR